MTDGEASVSPMEKLEMADSVEDKLEVWKAKCTEPDDALMVIHV